MATTTLSISASEADSFLDGTEAYIYDNYAALANGVTYAWDLYLANDIPIGGNLKIVVPSGVLITSPTIT